MKVQIAGGTGQQDSLVFDPSRSINCYPVSDPSGTEQSALFGTPGYSLFGTLGTGPWRKEFPSRATGRNFGISGAQLYEVNADGTGTVRGNLLQSSGIVYMEENPTQLAICDGSNLYILVYATNAFTRIIGNLSYTTNGNFPSAGTGWTLGSGWSAVNGYAYAATSSAALQQNSPVTLVSGKTYNLSYTLSDVSFVNDGTFNSVSDWTLGSGWSIGSNTAIATGAISTAVSQTTPALLVSGNQYLVTFTVVRTAGSIAVSLGGGTAGTSVSASSTVTQTITAGSTQTLAFTGTSFTGSIAAVSIIPYTTGSMTPSIGGTNGVTRTSAGAYTETIVAGSTQVVAFTGSSFTGTISSVAVTDLANGLPTSISTLDFIQGFFVASATGTAQFYKSALNDGTSWNALDFASKSSQPDNLSRVKQAVGQLWLLGQYTSEVWTNTGASSFPFQRIAGAMLSVGCAAPDSAIEMDNSILWLGQDKTGRGIVYRANGFTPSRISTTAIENIIAQATDISLIRAISYQSQGHLFYILNGGGLPTAVCYDVTTQEWHERAYLNADGTFGPWNPQTLMFAFGKHIVGDSSNGNLYTLDDTDYDDNGNPLVLERITPTLTQENKRIRFNMLQLLMETGVGNQVDTGSNPVIELYVSKDGARTWAAVSPASIGMVGQYRTQVIFRNLGTSQQITFKLRISDPVKRRIVGAYLS